MMGIYKITNNINNKNYIGQSVDIEKRWKDHKTKYNWERENKKILYLAFQKYGLENFSFSVIEECSIDQLNEREKYWIQYYNSYNGNGYNMTSGGESNGEDNHPKHKLRKEDVIDIRTRYKNLERRKEVFLLYNQKIGKSGFDKIWKGETWKNVMPEVYTDENKNFHLHNTGNSGSQNGRASVTEEDVRDIRTRRKNGEKLKDVYNDYKDRLTKGSFSNIWSYQNWKNITI